MALCFVKAECKLKGAREGTLGWECNCYKYMALCFVQPECQLKGAREGMLGWECNCYWYMAPCLSQLSESWRMLGWKCWGGSVTVGPNYQYLSYVYQLM